MFKTIHLQVWKRKVTILICCNSDSGNKIALSWNKWGKKQDGESTLSTNVESDRFADPFLFEDFATGWKCRSVSCDLYQMLTTTKTILMLSYWEQENVQITFLSDIFDSTSRRGNLITLL